MSIYPIRFGLHTGQQFAAFDQLIELWTEVERLDFDWISVFDHLRPPVGGFDGPCFEAGVTLAALAAKTERVRCALLVASPVWRHPSVLAASAIAVDHLSHGRLELGLGAGGTDLAHGSLGFARLPYPERMRYFDEFCTVVIGLLRESKFQYNGHYFNVDGGLSPRSVQTKIPITIGASGSRLGLLAAAKHADVWNTLIGPMTSYQQRARTMEEMCITVAHRDPASIRRSLTFRVVLGQSRHATRDKFSRVVKALGPNHPDVQEYIEVSSSDELVDYLGEFHLAGVDDFLLAMRPPIDYETLHLFSLEVINKLL